LDHIRRTPAIRDVVVSGGDPLTLPDEALEWLLMKLRAIPHVEVIRIGTKTPAVLPMRITSSLLKILRRANPLWMSLHFTHPAELTQETAEACARLADAGLPLGSQTVLLRGVNDEANTMRGLMTGLMRMRVRPYYLYQCDPILGSEHFRTPVSKGLEMIQALRGHVSGYAVPQYVIDAPGGGGKIPLLPEYAQGRDESGDLVLRNYQGRSYVYPDMPK
ncbi:MAG: KamA family radical SAM protein, partial [Planctomycetota bacterium]|nr:KamA family radical SAM protein [Planctomycetota bacterium]